MADYNNPFAEFEKFIKQMQLPGIDMEAMTEAYRKNLETLAAATRASNEGMQAVVRRQTEIVKDTLEQIRVATSELATAKDPKEAGDRQAEIARKAFEKAFANMKELAELMTKSNNESLEIIRTRMNEGLHEIESMLGKQSPTAKS